MTTAATAQQAAHANPEMEVHAQKEIEALLVRSAVDMDFRQRLLTQPNAAYSEATGNPVMPHIQFKFIEKKNGATTIVLPAFADDESPISESELEAVSGGSEPCTIVAVFVCTVAFAAGAWCVEKVLEATK